RLTVRPWLFGLALPLVMIAAQVQGVIPVSAATVVNYTFLVPVNIQMNPCAAGDVVDLHGSIHVVITSTSDNAGGLHMVDHLNSQFTGASLVTGTNYVNSEGQDDSWFAGAPFPVVHTHTYDFQLISQSGTDNYIVHM